MHVLTMKNQTNKDYDLNIVDYTRETLPAQNDEYRAVSGRDGMEHIPRNLGVRVVTVQFLRHNRSVSEWMRARADIVGWLYSKEQHEVRFDDEPGIYYVGKVTETTVPENYKPSVSFWITLTLQPFRYGSDVEVTLPRTTASHDIPVAGNYETPFLLKITVSSSASRMIVSTNGQSLTYTGNLVNGDVITIDTNGLELRVNGSLKVLEVDGLFTKLQPGPNTLTSNINGVHQLSYRERSI